MNIAFLEYSVFFMKVIKVVFGRSNLGGKKNLRILVTRVLFLLYCSLQWSFLAQMKLYSHYCDDWSRLLIQRTFI